MTINPNTLTAALGDRVWLDTNNNGIQDAGESGVAGVTVRLLDGIGRVLATQQTDANGNYLFTKLGGGQYAIEVVKPGNYTFTTRDAVGNTSDGTDSDVDANTGRSGIYQLAGGQTNLTVDAGLKAPPPPQTASLGDKVWDDTNGNGQQDTGEKGRAGVKVELYDCKTNLLLATTTTDANGNYLFSQLAAGTYHVKFYAPDGTLFTSTDAGSDTTDSDANASGITACYTLGTGETNLTVDAGLKPKDTASLGDRVWLDTNGNGLQDTGESGIANVTVNLLNSAGAVIGTQTTNTNGNYLFTGLAAGQYSVQFAKPTGLQFTTTNANSNGSDSLDSDVNTITGRTGTYTLAAGEQNLTVDAGLKAPTVTTVRDAVSVCEDLSKTFNVLGNDTGAGLKLINVRHETAALDTLYQNRAGAISFTADGTVVYKTMTNYYGNDRLVYTVQDATGRTFDQFVDVTVNAVSDAPKGGNGANYHPGEWDRVYTSQWVVHYQHIYTFGDFGDFHDWDDNVQQFGTLNTSTPNDMDVRAAFVINGLQGPSAATGKVLFNGVALDFSQGQSYEISVDDIKANKLVLDFTNPYDNYTLDYVNKDTGTIDNNACYDGEIYTDPKKITIITPVALDLNGDGRIGVTGATSSYQKDATAALGRTVSFDIDADGKKDTIEWFNGSGDGILIDNRDGLAATDMDGSRLFGGQDGYGNGYYKMAALDANQDGKLSGAELKGIELWVDNGDAVVQKGEIQTLAQHGIDAISTQLNLTYDAQGKLHIESTATRTDGSTLMSEDVFFAQANSSAPLPTLDSVLNFGSGALNKLLTSFTGGEAADTSAHASISASVQEHFADSEMLRKLVEVFSAGQHAQVAMA